MGDFSFSEWCISMKNEKKHFVAELTTDVLKGKKMYSYYHDEFCDVIMDRPIKNNNKPNGKQLL